MNESLGSRVSYTYSYKFAVSKFGEGGKKKGVAKAHLCQDLVIRDVIEQPIRAQNADVTGPDLYHPNIVIIIFMITVRCFDCCTLSCAFLLYSTFSAV